MNAPQAVPPVSPPPNRRPLYAAAATVLALDALRRLRDTPREGDEKSCGQDEAAAAVRALESPR